MINASIKTSAGISGFGFDSASLFRKVQMERLGNFALDTVIKRTKSGIGSNDTPFPPLSGKTSPIKHNGKFARQRIGYAGWKAAHGLNAVRDMVGTGKEGGHMLDNPSVRLATEDMVRMAFTSRSARSKALANEKRTPFFSFSPSDEAKIMQYAAQMFKAQVQAIRLLSPQAKAA